MTNAEALHRKLNGLPEETRERYAAMILAELEDEERWEALFASTTEEQWQALADRARADAREHGTMPLEQVLSGDDFHRH